MRTVVIGGGTTGLACAKVLADAGHDVTVLERDRYPAGPEARGGVPQSRHVHILLRHGYDRLCARFPGLDADLEAAGAPHLQITRDLIYHGPAGLAPRFSSPFEVVLPSRSLVELVLRRQIERDPRVRLLAGAKVLGLVADGPSVAGVRLRRGPAVADGAAAADGPAPEADEEVLPADLVVDASGRSSGAPGWLEALGLPAPPEQVIPADSAYATRWVRHPSPPADWRGIAYLPQGRDGKVAGFINPAEDGLFIVTLAGVKGVQPPVDEAGFAAFARALPEPRIGDFLEGATPVGPIAGWRRMGNTLRRYDRCERHLGGFFVVGDAFCAFNPVYGQGITVGVLGAEALGEHLARSADPRSPAAARAWFRRLRRVVHLPWTLATSQDLRQAAEVQGLPLDWLSRLSNPYMDAFLRLTTRDPAAFLAFLQVVHMVRSPLSLASPRFFGRVLWDLLAGPRAAA
jgi:2-polyprenyl-6-methoxyphenol hydroxylase-like FAD-dependent oxidoreductase